MDQASNLVQRFIITEEDKCLYQKRFLVGNMIFLIIVYYLIHYLYNNVYLTYISVITLLIVTMCISKNIYIKPNHKNQSLLINIVITLIILTIILQKSISFVYTDNCKQKECHCIRKYKQYIVLFTWLLLILLFILHKLHLIKYILNIPDKFSNPFLKFIIISMIMIIGSVVFNIGETAPIIILISAKYWNLINITKSPYIQFFISFIIMSLLSFILTLAVGYIFFEIGRNIDDKLIYTLFECIGYDKEYKSIGKCYY